MKYSYDDLIQHTGDKNSLEKYLVEIELPASLVKDIIECQGEGSTDLALGLQIEHYLNNIKGAPKTTEELIDRLFSTAHAMRQLKANIAAILDQIKLGATQDQFMAIANKYNLSKIEQPSF